MLDLLEQTRDVIDYAVKAHQSKVAHGLEAQVPFHGARAQILAVDKQIAAVKGQITNKLLPSKGKSPKRENLCVH